MIQRTFYLNQIKPYMNTEFIKIIVGIRRSGKSTLMKQIISMLRHDGVKEEQIIYMNFEDFRLREYKDKTKLFEYLDQKLTKTSRTYIFLDEIQEVEGFEAVVNSINTTDDVDIYLTGSNSKMLSGEYATLLSGRYISFNVFPFSFKEIVTSKKDKNMNLDEIFLDYVNYGGFPIIHAYDDESQKRQILSDLFDSIVINDIVQRHQVRNVSQLNKYLNYILNTTASQFSANNIIKYMKSEGMSISRDTLYNYIQYAKEVLLIYSAERYDIQGKKLLSTNEKYFVNDQGLRAVKYNNSKSIEKILENIVYFELLRRGYKVSVGTKGGKEIDFIASKQDQLTYVQVTYMMALEETRYREFSALMMIQDQFDKIVISMDKVDFSENGIKHLNIIDFLLE